MPADIYSGMVCQTCCVAYRRLALFLPAGLAPAVLAVCLCCLCGSRTLLWTLNRLGFLFSRYAYDVQGMCVCLWLSGSSQPLSGADPGLSVPDRPQCPGWDGDFGLEQQTKVGPLETSV